MKAGFKVVVPDAAKYNIDSSNPESVKRAKELYEKLCEYFNECGIKTQTGIFAADMQVELVNDGPVTLMLDSKKLF